MATYPMRAFDGQDIMSYLAEFVDHDQHLFIAPVSKAFRRAWGPRAMITRPVVADTSITQLRYCLKLGLPLRIRRTSICNAAARFGKLDVLELANEISCGWIRRLVLRPPGGTPWDPQMASRAGLWLG